LCKAETTERGNALFVTALRSELAKPFTVRYSSVRAAMGSDQSQIASPTEGARSNGAEKRSLRRAEPAAFGFREPKNTACSRRKYPALQRHRMPTLYEDGTSGCSPCASCHW